MTKDNEKQKISIEVPQEVQGGVYSNFCVISHSESEFLMDFSQMMPGSENKAVVRSRVIMTPENIKRVLAALKQNIDLYERNFGEISHNDHNMGNPLPPTIAPFGTGEA